MRAVVMLGLVSSARAACTLRQTTTVAYYGGSGATPDCQSWEQNFFGTWWGAAEPRIKVQRLTAADLQGCNLAEFKNLKLYVQPGGNAYDQQLSLGAQGKKNLLSYIRRGNSSFIGTCAGWFVSSTDYFWEGKHYSWANTLGVFPTVEGSITTIRDDSCATCYAMTNVTGPAGVELRALYWGGPTVGWRKTKAGLPSGAEQLLTFASIPGKLPAAVLHSNMLFFSVHLEAFVGHPPRMVDAAQQARNYRTRAAYVNRLVGENWALPVPMPEDSAPANVARRHLLLVVLMVLLLLHDA